MKLSVVFPEQPKDMGAFKAFGRRVAERPGSRLWTTQSTVIDCYQAVAYIAGAGIRVPIGLGVVLSPLVHPMEAANRARSLAILTGNEVWAGYGSGGQDVVAAMLGAPYAAPATAVGEYVDVVRRCLNDEPFHYQGKYYDVTHSPLTIDAPRVLLGTGILRPGMARVTGKKADFGITWLTPANYISDVLIPSLDEGAALAERDRPKVVSMVHAAVQRAHRDPVDLVKTANWGHLSAAHYRDMLSISGIANVSADPAEVAAQLVENQIFNYGSGEEIARQILGYAEIGVEEVVLNVSGVFMTEGLEAALADVQEILAAFDSLGAA
jgi:alkanesulfonate monooxygenase SsuD/methylene tetrahydromethanopterin reductase-like flavin-dependent oxidoreductase (luciferase family)